MVASKTSTHSPKGELARELSLFHITMMGLGMMIGAGVFLGIGNTIYFAGPGGVLLTFALNGLIAIFTAMSYAELSSAIPRAGGAYNFARLAFGRQSSFISGWMEWFASSLAGSLYSVTFAIFTVNYLYNLGCLNWLPFSTGVMEKIVAVIVALFFIYINYRGVSETGKIGAFFTLGQTLFLILIGVIGIVKAVMDPSLLENFNPFLPHGWNKLLVTMGFTYVAFEGFEVIAQTGDEAIDPKKNLPKAMLYSVLFVTITYVAVAFATIVAVKAGSEGVDIAPWKWIGQYREKGFDYAVVRLIPFAKFLPTLAVIFASTSALNATIYSATRASYALGRDRMLPSWFAKISKKQNTPYIALAATAAIVIIVASCLPTMDVASSTSIMFLFLFFMVNLCVIKIRRSMADELTYGFIMPLFPVFPILALLCQATLAVWLIHMSLIAWIVAPVWIILGFIIYHSYSKSNAVTTEDEILIIEEQKTHVSDKYSVMVSVANPDNAAQLVQSTYRLCGAKDAQVELLHVVPVPDQVSLTDAEKYIHPGKEAILEAMLYLSMHFPINTAIRYCRNIARGIVSAIREKKIKMLVLGWHGKPTTHLFNIGSTIDPIIEQAPCNVIVLKDTGGNKEFKNALVPIAGGPHGRFALEIASILTNPDGGTITAFNVQRSGTAFDLRAYLDEQTKQLHIPRHHFKAKTVESDTIVHAILKEAANYDLIVLGTTNKPLLLQIGRQSIPEKIARRCDKPVVIVKSDTGMRSWIKRWI